jgi:hypothetical protein
VSVRIIDAVFARAQKTGTQSGNYDPKDAFPSHGAWQVAVVLANFAHDDGTGAYPGLKRLMEYTGLSRSAVYEAIDTLKARRVIEEVGKRGRAREFRFLPPFDRPKRPESGQTDSPEYGPHSPLSGRSDPDPGGVDPVSGLEPSVNPIGNHPPPGKRAGSSPSGTDGNGSSAHDTPAILGSADVDEVVDVEVVDEEGTRVLAHRVAGALAQCPRFTVDDDTVATIGDALAAHPDAAESAAMVAAHTAVAWGRDKAWRSNAGRTFFIALSKQKGAGDSTKAERDRDGLEALARLTGNGRAVDTQRATANAGAYRDGHSNNGHSNGDVVACPDCGRRHDRLNRQRRFSREVRCDTCYETWEQRNLAEDGPVGA